METFYPGSATSIFSNIEIFREFALQPLHATAWVAESVAHAGKVGMMAGDAEVKVRNSVSAGHSSELRS